MADPSLELTIRVGQALQEFNKYNTTKRLNAVEAKLAGNALIKYIDAQLNANVKIIKLPDYINANIKNHFKNVLSVSNGIRGFIVKRQKRLQQQSGQHVELKPVQENKQSGPQKGIAKQKKSLPEQQVELKPVQEKKQSGPQKGIAEQNKSLPEQQLSRAPVSYDEGGPTSPSRAQSAMIVTGLLVAVALVGGGVAYMKYKNGGARNLAVNAMDAITTGVSADSADLEEDTDEDPDAGEYWDPDAGEDWDPDVGEDWNPNSWNDLEGTEFTSGAL